MRFSAILVSRLEGDGFVYSMIIGCMNLLVFCNTKGRIFGFFEDGTRFSSSDPNIYNEKWFKKIVNFFN